MQEQIDSTQILFLWRVALAGGEVFVKDVKPALDASKRKRLVAAHLIEVEKRKQSSGKGRAVDFAILTDSGWAALANHFDFSISASSRVVDVLQGLLRKLKPFLDAKQSSIAEFLTHSTPTKIKVEVSDPPYAEVEQQIRLAYASLSGDREGIPVRLAALRRQLPLLERQAIDETLLKMATERQLILNPIEDPQKIRDEDREAALQTVTGEVRHELLVGRTD